ncbi:MAG: leucine-rich repeat protein [Treponema sp.]|nr:leucine-rich repeat protein [Treponema sp.]
MNKKLLPHVITTIAMAVFIFTSLASANSPPSSGDSYGAREKPQQNDYTIQQQQRDSSFTGDGGKGISLAILAPKANGLEKNQSYLPALVQGEFVSNFSSFSNISVLDRERLDTQYAELLSGYYDDNAEEGLDLGHLIPTTHLMIGNITRTATGYALQIQITKNSDKMTMASYSGTFTFAELDNFTGIRRVSLDLLQKMGVTLTAHAQRELVGAAADNHVNAQTALARGVTARTEVAALSYFYQATAYDPSLREAANRSSILNANITSGNIGDNVRNDIQWRRNWVTRLTETEQYFDDFNRTESMPYTLFYSDEIKQGAVNYQNETVSLSIETHLHSSSIWPVSIERALQAVYDGLDATNRKDTWGLEGWPYHGVTNLNAFARRSGNFSVVFELLNNQNKIIGRQTLQTGGYWELSWSNRPVISVSADVRKNLNFQNVNANDISDQMTIRVTTVNGVDAESAARNGVLQIRASNKNEFDRNDNWLFVRGEIQGLTNMSERVGNLVIPNNIWGDPVIRIGSDAFKNIGLSSLTIQNGVIYIGNNAFEGNRLTSLTIPGSVTSIGVNAFCQTPWVKITRITIGANVAIAGNHDHSRAISTFGSALAETYMLFGYFYNQNNKRAGTYTYSEGLFERPSWTYSSR